MCKKEEFIMKPKVDFCFKELMADEEIRKGFISALLGIAPEEIVSTELKPTVLRKENAEDKLGILDVRVLVNGKEHINMEIQIAPFKFWAERSLFYLSKMYVEQIHEGQEYDVLQKCIHVGILDFCLFQEDTEYNSRFHIWEDNREKMYSDKFEIHILELPKLLKYEYPKTELLNWARFLNAERKEELKMISNENSYIGKAYERLERLSADEQKRLEYEAREKAIRDYNHQMKMNWQDGHEAGVQEGIKKGIEQTLLRLVREEVLTVSEAAKRLEITEDELQERLERR